MRSIRIFAVLMLLAAAPLLAQSAHPAERAAAATITAANVKQHIAFLASDALKGRDTPSPGLETAAKYVADQFQSAGLRPAGDSGSYIQRWPFQARKLDKNALSAKLHGAADRSLKYASEYFVLASPATDSLVGDVMQAGAAAPGLVADKAWAGKIVSFTIAGSQLDNDWVNSAKAAIMSGMAAGVKGIVLVLDPAFTADGVGNVAAAVEGQVVPVPVIGVRNDIATEWLKSSAARVEVHTGMSGISANPPNTVGILEGSDPVLKHTYVVFSAHMDHVGVGHPNAQGDSIYNGADDDASGTTAIIEVAKAFTSMKERPKRSIIFLGVSGEEKGLFGSKFFTEHPPVPIEQIVADINIDMIGRNNPDTTVAIGQDYTSLGASVQQIAREHPELHLTVAPDLWPQEGLFFRSDHFNFAMKKIPAIFFTSGLHKDYHQPSDEPQFIDNDKLARTARLVFWLGDAIANSSTVPTWTAAGLKAISQGGGGE